MGRLKNVLSKYSIDLMVAIYLIYKLFIEIGNGLNGWITAWYVMDYSYGFGSRLMLGSILHLIAGENISKEFAHNFVVIMLILLCILVAVICGMVYRSIPDLKIRYAVLFLVILYIASPASPEYLWTGENIGRLDTYLFLNTVIIALVYFKVKNMHLKYFAMTVISVFTILIHQVYFFLFFPALIVMAINDLWENGFSKKQWIYSLGTCIITVSVFLWAQFCSGIYYTDVNVLYEELCEHTDMYIDIAPLEDEFFWTIKDHFYNNQLPELGERVKFGFLTVCMLCPIWISYLYIWINAIKRKASKLDKAKYWLMLATNIAYIPVFALMTDWGRWFAALFIVAFLNIMVLAYKSDEGILYGLSKYADIVYKYIPAFAVIVLYIMSFEKFEGINMIIQVQEFYYSTYDFLHYLFGI